MQKIVLSNPFVLIFLLGTICSFLINHILEFISYRSRCKNKGVLPKELQGIQAASCFDLEKLKTICEYKNAKYFFWIPCSFLTLGLSLILVFTGFYPWLFNLICRGSGTPDTFGATYLCALLFYILASIPESILNIPLNLYNEFVIEKKFGFSKMTVKLWIIDSIKSFVVAMILNAILVFAICAVLFNFPTLWWVILTVVLFAITILMQVLYPLVIAPLFNKFVPLEDGELKQRITKLMENLGFSSNGIFVMDASKRSGHSNAYFGGMGKSKRIVLFDTLINQLSVDELEAVLGHELGHYKLHHILRKVCVMIPLELVFMLVLYLCAQSTQIYTGFGFAIAEEMINSLQFIGLFIASLVISSLSELTSPIMNYFSRKDEFAADKFSSELTKNPDALISGLIKLNSENLSELLPPKIYVAWNYSHPTLIERISALKNKE